MKSCAGFLLLEVLVAVAVLSGGIVLLFRAFSTCLAAGRMSELRLQSALLAEGAVWEVEQWKKATEAPAQAGPASWRAESLEPEDEKQPWRVWVVSLERDDLRDRVTLEAVLPAEPKSKP